MKPIILKYGLIYGVILLIGFVSSYLLLGTSPDNYSASEIAGYTIMLISSIAIIFGIKEYRDNSPKGEMGFWSGFTVGSAISAIAGTIFGLYNWVYITWIDPNFVENYQIYYADQIKNSGQPKEVIDRQLAELAAYPEWITNSFFQSALMFTTVFLIGLLFTGVASAAFKKSTT